MDELKTLKDKVLQGGEITEEEATRLYSIGSKRPLPFMAYASEIREHFKGKKVSLCAIVNAKSGLCAEDCRFCAQSAHHNTDIERYPLITKDEMVDKARQAKMEGAHFFGIVTSGTSIESDEELREIERAIKEINALGIRPCASLGMIGDNRVAKLKEAGLLRYHHNLETARSFFSNICTTHDYDKDIETIKAAKRVGLSVCCGGIIGLGETMEQRMELAFTLRGMEVDSVPINILNPIPGTPFESIEPLQPMEVLITIAIYRFILPDKDIRLCGGKERSLRQLLPMGIIAGANALMIGNYLTTMGRDAALNIEMIRDLGLMP